MYSNEHVLIIYLNKLYEISILFLILIRLQGKFSASIPLQEKRLMHLLVKNRKLSDKNHRMTVECQKNTPDFSPDLGKKFY